MLVNVLKRRDETRDRDEQCEERGRETEEREDGKSKSTEEMEDTGTIDKGVRDRRQKNRGKRRRKK